MISRILAAAALLIVVAFPAAAQGPAPAPPRPPGYDRLQPLVGRWTLEGRETTFTETCEWYEGNFMIVCRSESRGKDGTTRRGTSVLGYLPEEDAFTYHGFDSRGRNETMRGRWVDGVFEWVSEAMSDGKLIKSRVRMGPFGAAKVDFVAESAVPGGPWTVDLKTRYVRLP